QIKEKPPKPQKNRTPKSKKETSIVKAKLYEDNTEVKLDEQKIKEPADTVGKSESTEKKIIEETSENKQNLSNSEKIDTKTTQSEPQKGPDKHEAQSPPKKSETELEKPENKSEKACQVLLENIPP